MFYRKQENSEYLPQDIEQSGDDADRILKSEIKQLVNLLVRDNHFLLDNEAFVIGIHGAWGTGKTYSSNLLLRHLGQQSDFSSDKTHVFKFELLSFGNINESVASILTQIGSELYSDGVVDVRNELKQMIIDATQPDTVNTSVDFMGLSLSKSIAVNSNSKPSKKHLADQFGELAKKGRRFVVVLDDLDRMKPSEIIIVLRMVENFRKIPGFIFILPFHKVPVTHGIDKELNLDKNAAYVFLRKFMKASITIRLGMKDLRMSFIREFEKHLPAASQQQTFGISLAESGWYTMMHTILIQELADSALSNDSFSSPNASTQVVQMEINNPQRAGYVKLLHQKLSDSALHRDEGGEEYLKRPYFPIKASEEIKPFYKVYPDLAPSIGTNAIYTLLRFLEEELFCTDIWSDSTVHAEMRARQEALINERNNADDSLRQAQRQHPNQQDHIQPFQERSTAANNALSSGPILAYSPSYETKEKQTLFEHLLLPRLKEAEKQNLDFRLTEYFSRRDMEQLAGAFAEDLAQNIPTEQHELLRRLIAIATSIYREFK